MAEADPTGNDVANRVMRRLELSKVERAPMLTGLFIYVTNTLSSSDD
jgi:hypothetical protein